MEWIVTSSVLILIVLLLRTVLKGKISLRLQYALWGLVLIRLLLPVSIGQLRWSAASAAELLAPVEQTIDSSKLALPINEYYEFESMDAYDAFVEANKSSNLLGYKNPEFKQIGSSADGVWAVIPKTAPWHTVLRTVWIFGGTVTGIWFLFSNLHFGRKLRRERRTVCVPHYPLSVYRSSVVETPCLFGLVRPAVYLTDEVTEETMEHVLAHELTHSRHGDHIWSALRCLCLVIHWYNPLVWLAAFLSRRDAELACDEGTLKRIGEEQRTAYGRTLIDLTCCHRSKLALTATTMTGSRRGIKERVLLIAKKPRMKKWVLAVLLVLVIAAAGCTFSGAGETKTPGSDDDGYVWIITLLQPEESDEMAFSEMELQTPSGELCIQNRNLFPVLMGLYDGDEVILEDTIYPGGQCIFKQAYADVAYRLAVRAEVEPGTEIHLKVYDGNAEQEPYELETQPVESEEPSEEIVYSWADWSEEDIARWQSETDGYGLVIQTDTADELEVRRVFAEALAARFVNASEDHPARCTDAVELNSILNCESLAGNPKRLIFSIEIAYKPVNEQTFIHWNHGWVETLGEGWYSDGFYYTLEQTADGSWECTDVGTGGYGGWGYLNYEFEGVFDIYFQEFLNEEETMEENMLATLFSVDWENFDARWGAEGRGGLKTLLDTVCLTEGRVYGPEQTRMWSDVYPQDQLYRNLYVMYGALKAGVEFEDIFGEVLKKQQTYNPAIFGEALLQLPSEMRTFVENLMN